MKARTHTRPRNTRETRHEGSAHPPNFTCKHFSCSVIIRLKSDNSICSLPAINYLFSMGRCQLASKIYHRRIRLRSYHFFKEEGLTLKRTKTIRKQKRPSERTCHVSEIATCNFFLGVKSNISQ